MGEIKIFDKSDLDPARYLKSIGDFIFGQKNVLNTINFNIVVFIYLDTLLILLRIVF